MTTESSTRPLELIAQWASLIRQGRFSARLDLDGQRLEGQEWASVQDDINRLAEWLQSLVQERDDELRNKTAEIQSHTRSLKLLYEFTNGLDKTYDVQGFISGYLSTFKSVTHAGHVEAFLYDDEGEEMLLATLGEPDKKTGDLADHCLVVPIKYQDRIYGEYRLYMQQPVQDLPQSTRELLASIGMNLGMALEKSNQDKQSLLLGRMEERTRLAHELHDSMAQTLASLRYQVRILDDTLHSDDESSTWSQLEKVEQLLEGAHDELRSLIGQFRAPIESGGLATGFKKIMSRFRTETGVPVFFHNQWDNIELLEETEVNIIRIAQEALKNICKHSQADAVRILLRISSKNECQMIIEDDGIGFEERPIEPTAGDHIGLTVMRERAVLIGGRLNIDSGQGEGTRILLSFKP